MTTRERIVGSFATGESKVRQRTGVLAGDFAAGQERDARTGRIVPRGDFATGMERQHPDPTSGAGDFARGQRREALEDVEQAANLAHR